MEMSQIEAFVTIAQVKGFSRAATILHLSQPAISRRINLLEQELGNNLFERVHGGAILTEAGHTFLPFARQVLAAARDGIEAVQAVSQQEQGTIRLALVGTLASTDLTHRLLQFRQKFPDVQLTLRTARSNEVSALVQSGEVHLGLRYFADPHPDVVSKLVEEEDLVVVYSAQYPLTTEEPSQPQDLIGIPWVSFPTGEGSSGEPFAQLLEKQLIMWELGDAEIITIDSLTAQKRLIETGFGFGLLPISSVQEELKLETLSIVNVPIFQAKVPVMILRRKQGYSSKATRTLLDELLGPKEST